MGSAELRGLYRQLRPWAFVRNTPDPSHRDALAMAWMLQLIIATADDTGLVLANSSRGETYRSRRPTIQSSAIANLHSNHLVYRRDVAVLPSPLVGVPGGVVSGWPQLTGGEN